MNKKRHKALIRIVWGNCFDEKGVRNGKVYHDIQKIKDSPIQSHFCTLVYGKRNYDYLTNLGFDCHLISEKDKMYSDEFFYAHKVYAFKKAFEYFDEIVYLDWDCVQVKYLPDDFWDTLSLKKSIQSCLFQYKTKKCLWRDIDHRKTCNGGFVYIREKQNAYDIWGSYLYLIDMANEIKNKRLARNKELRVREKSLMFDDEPAISHCIDNYSNGWQGKEFYLEHYEPECCKLRKKSVFNDVVKQNVVFEHLV